MQVSSGAPKPRLEGTLLINQGPGRVRDPCSPWVGPGTRPGRRILQRLEHSISYRAMRPHLWGRYGAPLTRPKVTSVVPVRLGKQLANDHHMITGVVGGFLQGHGSKPAPVRTQNVIAPSLEQCLPVPVALSSCHMIGMLLPVHEAGEHVEDAYVCQHVGDPLLPAIPGGFKLGVQAPQCDGGRPALEPEQSCLQMLQGCLALWWYAHTNQGLALGSRCYDTAHNIGPVACNRFNHPMLLFLISQRYPSM